MSVEKPEVQNIPHFDLSQWDRYAAHNSFKWVLDDFMIRARYIASTNTIIFRVQSRDTVIETFNCKLEVEPQSIEEITREVEQCLHKRYNRW